MSNLPSSKCTIAATFAVKPKGNKYVLTIGMGRGRPFEFCETTKPTSGTQERLDRYAASFAKAIRATAMADARHNRRLARAPGYARTAKAAK